MTDGTTPNPPRHSLCTWEFTLDSGFKKQHKKRPQNLVTKQPQREREEQ